MRKSNPSILKPFVFFKPEAPVFQRRSMRMKKIIYILLSIPDTSDNVILLFIWKPSEKFTHLEGVPEVHFV